MIGLPGAGVVGGHRAVRVQPHHLPGQDGQVLGAGRDAVVPDDDVELAVGAEHDAAAVVHPAVGKLRRTAKPLPSARMRRSWFVAVPETSRVTNAHTRPLLG